MQRKGRGVQISLEDNAGGVDEMLILRRMRHRMLVEVGGRPQRPQIDVDDSVRLRQKPGGFRRRDLAEINRAPQQHQDDNHNGNGKLRAPAGHLSRNSILIISSGPACATPDAVFGHLQGLPRGTFPSSRELAEGASETT